MLNLEHGIDGIINVLMHQLLRISMSVLYRNIIVEGVYLSVTPWTDFVSIFDHGREYTSLTI